MNLSIFVYRELEALDTLLLRREREGRVGCGQ